MATFCCVYLCNLKYKACTLPFFEVSVLIDTYKIYIFSVICVVCFDSGHFYYRIISNIMHCKLIEENAEFDLKLYSNVYANNCFSDP